MTDPVEILVEHVLLTSHRSGLAACASEGCEWSDKFVPVRYWHDVPTHIKASHARHQLDLLADAGFGYVTPETATPRGGW